MYIEVGAMNKELILKLVQPYLKDNKLTYEDFDRLFCFLSKKEQYLVVDVLIESNIDFLSEDDENNNDILNESISDTELVNSIDDEIDFHNLYGETFKDEYVPQTVITNASDIKQSNEILCRLIQEEGSEQAKQDLCIKNKALVDKYAWAYGKKYITKLSFEDLEQSGMIGLIKAAEKFDIRKGYSFSTYAVWWVKQAVVRDIQDTGFLIRLPVHVMEKINKISNIESQYVGFGINRAECINAIADELEMPKEYVEHYMYIKDQYLSVASLNTPVGEDENSELIEFISGNDELSAEEIIILKSLKEVLEKQLLRLTDKEQKILRLRFGMDDGHPRTLEEIGTNFNVTRERIRQIESRALKKLRTPFRLRNLEEYLEDLR